MFAGIKECSDSNQNSNKSSAQEPSKNDESAPGSSGSAAAASSNPTLSGYLSENLNVSSY